MYNRILVPTDGSQGTDRAVGHALDFAETVDADVDVLYVVDSRPYAGIDLADDEALERAARRTGRQAITAIRDQAADVGIEVTQTIRTGVPHAEILDYIDDRDIDLVVMGTSGRTGAELAAIGSTTERVLRRTAVPVFTLALADGPVAAHATYDDLLVPIDGSEPAVRAAEHAVGLADRVGASVHALYVVNTNVFEFQDAPRSLLGSLRQGGQQAVSEIESLAAAAGVPATASLAEGQPYRRILEYADEANADLITLGRRGRTGKPEVLLGSVTARVVRLSETPVLSTT